VVPDATRAGLPGSAGCGQPFLPSLACCFASPTLALSDEVDTRESRAVFMSISPSSHPGAARVAPVLVKGGMPARGPRRVYEWVEGARHRRRTRFSRLSGSGGESGAGLAGGHRGVGELAQGRHEGGYGARRGRQPHRSCGRRQGHGPHPAHRRRREVRRQDRGAGAGQRQRALRGRGQAPWGPEPRQLLPGGVHAAGHRGR
jgi:hypothetical protein